MKQFFRTVTLVCAIGVFATTGTFAMAQTPAQDQIAALMSQLLDLQKQLVELLKTGGTAALVNENPVPIITAMAPSTIVAGSSGFNIQIYGSNFESTSSVKIDNGSRGTTFINPYELTAFIPMTDVAAAGSRNITVTNTSSGNTSAAQSLTITDASQNPAPQISGLSPSSKVTGSGAFTMTINGSNFAPTAIVKIDGATRATTFVNASQLTASIFAADIINTGPRSILVVNPTPGGGTSNAQTFTVNAAPPPPPPQAVNYETPSFAKNLIY